MKEKKESLGTVLCVRCAWRKHCAKQFSFDNTQPIKCPDFTLDVTLRSEERDGRQGDSQGTG